MATRGIKADIDAGTGLDAMSRKSDTRECPREELLRFIFDSHMHLFNTRREHEWRVIIGALVLMGAVDYAILSEKIALNDTYWSVWCVALALLFGSIVWYQWGIQIRNRVDRVAMDQVLVELCDAIRIPKNSPIRVGVDRESEHILGAQIDLITSYTYLWAFIPQMLLLAVACILSGYIPALVSPAL